MPASRPLVSRTVWILAMVSLFADFASEMLYPVVPVYLKQIGFSVALIGLLEGIAEFVVGLTKGYFGQQSDRLGKRLPFVKVGYSLSAISKPMMAVFSFPAWIFLSRTTDRLGKGLRTAPRDALLAAESTPATRARVFGFHRSWDTVGAVLGPLAALAFLHFFPGNYRPLFFWAFLPGLLSITLLLLLREKKQLPRQLATGNIKKTSSFFSFFSFWPSSPRPYKKLLPPLLLFALANSSDAFLLLQTRALTGSDTITIAAYVFYNVVYAITAFPLGILADKWGYKKMLAAGLMIFVLVYAGFGFAGNLAAAGSFLLPLLLFFMYGIYAAATEGVSKAWISNTLPSGFTATGIGLYSSLQSTCTLLSSILAGILWSTFGPATTFLVAAFLAAISAGWLIMVNTEKKGRPTS